MSWSRYKRPHVAVTLPRGGDRLCGVSVRFGRRYKIIGPKDCCYLTDFDGVEHRVGPIAMLEEG